MATAYTPMLEQYRDVKSRHSQEILFFRLGDFYEMFFEDAELASRELEITLTSREGGQGKRIPMCGIPYHAAENYLARLVQKGYKVAICEQVEDPKQVKGLVRREVVRIVTPGTFLGEVSLSEKSNHYLALVREGETGRVYLAAADLSTGECFWSVMDGEGEKPLLWDALYRLQPKEIIVSGHLGYWTELDEFSQDRLYCRPEQRAFAPEAGAFVKQHFAPTEQPNDKEALQTVEHLLCYLHETVKTDLAHINRLAEQTQQQYLLLDASTLRNLEITRNLRDGGRKATLLQVLDFTRTAMGGRLLKHWLEQPLRYGKDITKRHEAVEELTGAPLLRQALVEALEGIYDFERIVTRVELGTANARDLVSLSQSLAQLPALRVVLNQAQRPLLRELYATWESHAELAQEIGAAFVESPPVSVREGGMIRSGYDSELDELREVARDSKCWVEEFERSEKEKTGIRSLKIGYNKVFGYYLEVTHANTSAVPAYFQRKQTLANAERYITPELKEFETKILGAQERIVQLEYHLFCRLRDRVKEELCALQATARRVAVLDVLHSFADAAVRHQYVRPRLEENGSIQIQDGRHPVVERLLKGELFVPNDTQLFPGVEDVMVITGPNMAGKSTYMRQVALLVLMAQAGSFLPVRSAVISPVDRIFTRVGASDDLATGQSTFMMEMNEVAAIVRHATKNSLVILDEIGRGTSTFDGMSIARAVVEYIKKQIGCKTLFATHYHELTELENAWSGIRNYSVAVREKGNNVVFLRRIVPGGADKSYGIHVAQLAGLPSKVIQRAKEVLAELETCSAREAATPAVKKAEPSLTLFGSALTEELLGLDVMSLTPIEALNTLFRLQNQAKEEMGR